MNSPLTRPSHVLLEQWERASVIWKPIGGICHACCNRAMPGGTHSSRMTRS